MKKLLLTFLAIILIAGMYAQDCSDLFISEYVEGTGNSKAIEIYNPTPNPIDLSSYQIKRYSNGATTADGGGVLNLSGTIQPYSTWVVANGQTEQSGSFPPCDPALQALADQLDGDYPAPTYFNGNDAITLENINGMFVDIFGKIGEDPGEGWCDIDSLNYASGTYYWLSWTSNHTLIRKASVKQGVTINPGFPGAPEFFTVQQEWDTVPGYWSAEDTAWHTANIWDNLGSHDCECDPAFNAIPSLEKQKQAFFFPNPVRDQYFMVKANALVRSVQIINPVGQEIFYQENKIDRGDMRVDLPGVKTGMYIAIITFKDNTRISKKFIVR